MQTTVRCTFEKVRFDQEKDVHAVISLTAPKVDWQAKRASIAVLPVIDISGSMGDQAGPEGSKLDYVKKSLYKLIDHLQPGDWMGLVTFTTDSFTVAAPMEMTQSKKDELKTKIGQLVHQASTNFAAGMMDGLGHLNKLDLPPGVTLRAIMFTDGLANAGVASKRPELVELCGKHLGKASLSCFGYGNDCDQELLRDVAAKGKGNFAYIKNPDDALTAFARELGGLLSTYAKNISIHAAPQGSHKIEKVLSDVDTEEDNGKVTIKIPDILGEEQRHIVLSMKLAAQNQALPRALNVLEVSGSYELINSDGTTSKKTFDEKLKVEFVKPGEEQTTPTKEVDQIVSVAQLADAQVQAEQFAAAGNYYQATAVMDWMEQDFNKRGLIASAGVSNKLKGTMRSAQAFSDSSRYRISTKGYSGRAMGMSLGDSEAQADLESMGTVSCNAAQTNTTSSFQGNTGQTPPPQPEEKKPEPKKGLSKSRSKRW